MANYNPTLPTPTHTGECGNGAVYYNQCAVGVAPALNDQIRPVKVPAGTAVHRVVIRNTDMDTNGTPTLAAKIGFTPVDSSITAPSGADTAIAAAAAWGQAAVAPPTGGVYEVFPPYVVEVDSYLNIVVTTGPATGATGTVYAKVEGDAIGPK